MSYPIPLFSVEDSTRTVLNSKNFGRRTAAEDGAGAVVSDKTPGEEIQEYIL